MPNCPKCGADVDEKWCSVQNVVRPFKLSNLLIGDSVGERFEMNGGKEEGSLDNRGGKMRKVKQGGRKGRNMNTSSLDHLSAA